MSTDEPTGHSTFELRWQRDGYLEVENAFSPGVTWLEFVIDGMPLRQLLKSKFPPPEPGFEDYDPVPNIGVIAIDSDLAPSAERKLFNDWNNEQISILLGEQASRAMYSRRVPLYTCSCGDYNCGTVCARIERRGDAIIWHEFRWEVNYCSEGEEDKDLFIEYTEAWREVGPFVFDYHSYAECFRKLAPPPLPRFFSSQN